MPSVTPKCVLNVQALSKSFGGLRAVRGVSLTLEPRRIHGLIGPNGAGKSTLFGLIAGDMRPDSGSVLLNGRDVTALPVHDRARIGMARTFQIANVFDSLSVWDNVLIGAEKHNQLGIGRSIFWHSRPPAEVETRVRKTLALVGIADLDDLPASLMTFGQQRLLATARAIASNPKLLLLDEPAAGLSGPEIEALTSAIKQVSAEGTTVIIVEHNMNLVMNVCEHILVMNLGEKIAEGTPAEIKGSRTVSEAYLGL
jgi:ABC-type branched-subunit amino acid transport system ATPase component